jgi:hypothetical protein
MNMSKKIGAGWHRDGRDVPAHDGVGLMLYAFR